MLGVNDRDPVASVGMSPSTLAEWLKYDDVADQISRYADPGVAFVTSAVDLDDGDKKFVVIEVDEFSDIPVICKKALDGPKGKPILRAGATYVRSGDGKIESRDISNVNDARRLLDLAAEKRLRHHISMTSRAGGLISSAAEAEMAARDRFASELGDLA